MESIMNNLPIVGALIIEHDVDEDCGVNHFNLYTMIDSIVDNGVEVYILKSEFEGYCAVTHSHFEGYPVMRVVDFDNKPIRRSIHGGKDILVQFDIFANNYEICLTEKSSDKVFNDVVDELNNRVGVDNFRRLLGKAHRYRVRWNNDKYEWLAEKT
jgi:hypothetical protein